MSLEAIKSISEAEERAGKARLEARQRAERAVDEARKAGNRTVETTIERAESEVAALKRAADAKAAQSAKELVSKTFNKRAAIKSRAESRLDAAAGIIIERIVGGEWR
jgi:V/A-type H+-transporting ATPase subunit G/H